MSKQKLGKLALRYARALYNAVAAEMGTSGSPTPAQKVAEQLNGFSEVWLSHKDLREGLLNPMFAADERAQALSEVVKLQELPEVVQRFFAVLFQRDRIAALPEIAEAFEKLSDKHAGVVQVEVTTAREMSGEETEEIKQGLVQQIEGDLVFQWQVDPEILGGLIVKYGEKILDGSVSGRLQRLEGQLTG